LRRSWRGRGTSPRAEIMGLFDSIFRRNKPKLTKLRYARADDQKMSQAAALSQIHPSCECLAPQFKDRNFGELRFHSETQDTGCEAWKSLELMIEEAAAKQTKEFAPGLQMQPEHWSQIVTLPASIAKLKSVQKLYLYRSHLIHIPAEIGEMENLEEFDAYTSYRLHWLPYEITRCKKLTRSRMSTRALYGNFKYRPPFPRLGGDSSSSQVVTRCSICAKTLSASGPQQVWISLRVATDVMPLLVNACSEACIRRLPSPAKGYVDHPHSGGLDLPQPSPNC